MKLKPHRITAGYKPKPAVNILINHVLDGLSGFSLYFLVTFRETRHAFSCRTLKPVFTIFVDPRCPRAPSRAPRVWPPTIPEHPICIAENKLPNQSRSSRWCGSPTLPLVTQAWLIVRNTICSRSVSWSSALPPPAKPRPAQRGGP